MLIGSIWAVGLTVIVNVSVGPVLLFPPFSKSGVTTTVVVIGDVPVFTAVNPISLEPVVVSPVVGSVFVQVYVVVPPVFIVVNGIVTVSPSDTTISSVGFTWAVGLIVISKGVTGPIQSTEPFSKVGVTFNAEVTGLLPVFIPVNAEISPVPLAARPIEVILFVQSKVVVPFTFVVKNVI